MTTTTTIDDKQLLLVAFTLGGELFVFGFGVGGVFFFAEVPLRMIGVHLLGALDVELDEREHVERERGDSETTHRKVLHDVHVEVRIRSQDH